MVGEFKIPCYTCKIDLFLMEHGGGCDAGRGGNDASSMIYCHSGIN